MRLPDLRNGDCIFRGRGKILIFSGRGGLKNWEPPIHILLPVKFITYSYTKVDKSALFIYFILRQLNWNEKYCVNLCTGFSRWLIYKAININRLTTGLFTYRLSKFNYLIYIDFEEISTYSSGSSLSTNIKEVTPLPSCIISRFYLYLNTLNFIFLTILHDQIF